MPIDARIPLGYQPPQFEATDPARTLFQGMQLKDLALAGEERRLQMDQQQAEIERQRAVRESFVFTPEGRVDVDATIPRLMQVDTDLGLRLQTRRQEEIRATAEEERKQAAESRAQQAAGAARVQAVQDELRRQAEEGRKAAAEKRAAEAAANAAAESQARLPGIEAETARKQVEAGQVAEYGMTAVQKASADAAQQRIHAMRQRAAQGLGAVDLPEATPIPANWQPGMLNEAALAKYPAAVQQRARKLVDYSIPYPTGTAQRDPTWQAAINAASELDPTWTASDYQSRLAARKSFTSGKDAANITSINTAIGHLATLKQAGLDLENWDFPWWNKIANVMVTATGDPRVRRFNVAATALENELATVFKQTGATDQEIKAWRKDIDAADSPEQLRALVNQAWELLTSRMEALQGKWEASMGKPADFEVLTPKSKEVLAKMGITAPAGQAEQRPVPTHRYDPATGEMVPVS